MNKIEASSALAAVTLAGILDSEGHTAVWFLLDGTRYFVATNAPLSAIMACVQTTETVLRVPAHMRTCVTAGQGAN